ncbi:hypothetical protein GCM10010388_49180 [Streptomyces mauvecolor]
MRYDGRAEHAREAAGGSQPLRPGEHFPQQGDPYGIHDRQPAASLPCAGAEPGFVIRTKGPATAE